MTESDVIARVRAAVDARVGGVESPPPPLDRSYTPTGDGRHRRRWVTAAALAAAAVIVLGVVVVSRGGGGADVDDPAVTDEVQQLPSQWILDMPGAVLDGVVEDIDPATPTGTNVYYAADDLSSAAVVRTHGASQALTRSSWPNVESVTVLGRPATLLSDDDQQLLVVSGDPSLIVEGYGGVNTQGLVSSSRIEDGVVIAGGGATEIGRYSRATDGPLTSTVLTYRYGDKYVVLARVDHPAGLAGYLLDHAVAPTSEAVDAQGRRWLVYGTSAAYQAAGGEVVVVAMEEGLELDPVDVAGFVVGVDEARWQALLAAIGDDPVPTTAIAALPRYQAVATVIEVAGEGVKLCLGGVAESLPPQCDGVPVDAPSWRWPDGTFEEIDGTRWAEYVVVGTYDGSRFTVTDLPRPATPDDYAARPSQAPDYSTPCPTPEGGWLAAAAGAPQGSAFDDAMAKLGSYREEQADFVGTWLDHSIDPEFGTAASDASGSMNDPTKFVLNVAFTGDVERHEAELAEIWTGALCVSESGGRAFAELAAVQAQLYDLADGVLLENSIDETRGVLDARFVLVTPTLQAELDSRFGVGTVIATSALVPVEG